MDEYEIKNLLTNAKTWGDESEIQNTTFMPGMWWCEQSLARRAIVLFMLVDVKFPRIFFSLRSKMLHDTQIWQSSR